MKNNLLLFSLLLVLSNQNIFAQKTWIGQGAGGSGTNFNTPSNWSPSGVPGPADNVTIALTTNATITLSANASVKNLIYTVSGNNKVGTLDVVSYTLTVNGTASIEVLSGNINTYAAIGVNDNTSAGIIDFKGNVTYGITNLSNPSPIFIGNTNSKMIFRGSLTLGPEAYTDNSSVPGTIEFDGTGTQTITWNNSNWSVPFKNVNIGNTNNPTVVQTTGTGSPTDMSGNLTVNGSSVLNLGTSFWNRSSSGGSLTLNSTSVLKLGANSGGQTGSNFPDNFTTLSLNAGSTVEYNSTSSQTIYDVPSPGYGNVTVSNNSTKTAGGSLNIRGTMLVNSPATFAAGAGLSHTVSGNWSNSGSFTPSTSTITFNGSSQQTVQGSSATTFYNLIFNNTANNGSGDIILNGVDVTIINACTFTDGIVNSAANMLIFNDNATVSGASNISFANVKVRKIGNDAFTFPVGKLNVGYVPCGISAPATTTDAFTAEYKRNNASTLGSITAVGLARVSGCEYWQLDRTTGTSSVNVTLSWSGVNPCSAAAYVTLLSQLVVAHFDGAHWNAAGRTSSTGGPASGTLTWNGVSSFSPFTLGSTSATVNPLPVKFSSVKAFRVNTGNRIDWTNLTEEDLKQYEVERSADGTSFNTIYTIAPNTNDGQEENYTVTDDHILSGTNFYRIRAVQSDGSYIYSAIVKVEPQTGGGRYVVVYPNPVVSDQFTLQLNNYIKGSYVIKLINTNGQQIMNKVIQHPGGSVSIGVERPKSASSGLYILQVTGDGVNANMKLVIK